jgi:ADP-heptose:LPS heptosyltransferase
MTAQSSTAAFRVMRRVDQFLGPPVCLAVSAVKALRARVRPPGQRAPAGHANILVIKFWGMGSIVLTTPMLRALKAAYPGCRITFLTFEQNESLCRAIRSIDRVYAYRAISPAVFLRSFAALVSFLRRERFDVAIDLEFFANFTAIVTAISGAPVTVGYDGPKSWRRPFYTNRFAFDHKHITEVFLKAASALGVEVGGAHLDAPVVDDELRAARLNQLLRDREVAATDQLICINVNASPLEYKRRWPLASYAELIRRLLATLPAIRLVLIGSSEDTGYVDALIRQLGPHRHLINLCGSIDIGQLVLLLRRARLLIGNDSGPLHLAVAVGTPTVSFFGPETPALYGPQGDAHTVLYKNLPCSPCLNVYNSKENPACHDNVCMQAIGVDEAWAAVCARLTDSAAGAPRKAVGSP